MRKLTFKTYLENYIRDISGLNTLNIHKLVNKCKKEYRLLDSLILYCGLYGNKELFNKYTNNKYRLDINSINEDSISVRDNDHDYLKIWECYQNKLNTIEYDNDTKSKARLLILSEMKEKGITNYRVYTDLNLNPGNINDYLTNGNVYKVSLNTVKRISSYVRSN